jgi:CubicO group peptidase (beta-lactamase class C family)
MSERCGSRLTALLTGVVVVLMSACVHHVHHPHHSGLASVVAKAVDDLQPVPATGLAVAVLQGGDVTYLGGFGLRDRERGLRVDRHTIFGIGSATKAFTSMGIAMLVNDGVVSLDTPIKSYLPGFAMKDPVASAEMTLRDILSHQTGLPRHDVLWYLGPFSPSQLFYRLPYLDPNPVAGAGFRKAFEYNNLMYMTAGYLQEVVTGQSWHSALRTRIFVPLDMHQSTSSIEAFAEQKNTAKGYVGEAALPLKDVNNIAPAGAINSNVVDMARWVALHLRRGLTVSGTRLISEEGLEAMYKPYVSVPAAGGADVGYGLGWFVASMHGQRILFHSGHTDGYSAYVSFMPEARLGVIALTNQHVNAFPKLVATRIYGHLLKTTIDRVFTPENVILDPSMRMLGPVGQQPGPIVVSDLDGHTGRYVNDGYGDVTVWRTGSKLHLSYYEGSWRLHCESDQKCYFELRAYGADRKFKVDFSVDGRRRIDSLGIEFDPNFPPIRFSKR